ncbi:MAG: LLM class flavin-dependent oxidoreductase [Actinobacteria bacterium]|nr:MAG: LLM class flavin-dependent oxidoreductase [Actinomycetota bacterium]RIK07683.1 MAG: LLM class flavin-dependent oxidoreductase [Acidobacteriota bacterium]
MDFSTIVERVRAAEQAGFASIWLMDHLAAPASPASDTFEGWTTAAALAPLTETIRLGHLVLCDPLRHPAVLAKMAATLDVISGGRLELGLGWGSVEAELHAYGVTTEPALARAARLAETLDVLDLMFSGEAFDYAGDHVQLVGAIGRPVPLQERIPIHIGGGGRQLTMPLVRERADWWNCPSYAIDRFEELRPLAGRARVSVQHPIGLAPTAASRREVVETAERRFGGWGGLVAGTAAEVAAALSREAESGVELFICQFSDFAQPETLQHFATEVMPAVSAAR